MNSLLNEFDAITFFTILIVSLNFASFNIVLIKEVNDLSEFVLLRLINVKSIFNCLSKFSKFLNDEI